MNTNRLLLSGLLLSGSLLAPSVVLAAEGNESKDNKKSDNTPSNEGNKPDDKKPDDKKPDDKKPDDKKPDDKKPDGKKPDDKKPDDKKPDDKKEPEEPKHEVFKEVTNHQVVNGHLSFRVDAKTSTRSYVSAHPDEAKEDDQAALTKAFDEAKDASKKDVKPEDKPNEKKENIPSEGDHPQKEKPKPKEKQPLIDPNPNSKYAPHRVTLQPSSEEGKITSVKVVNTGGKSVDLPVLDDGSVDALFIPEKSGNYRVVYTFEGDPKEDVTLTNTVVLGNKVIASSEAKIKGLIHAEEVKKVDIPFKRIETPTNTLRKGEKQVKTEGIKGVKTIKKAVIKNANGQVMQKDEVSNDVTTPPVNEEVLVGTGVPGTDTEVKEIPIPFEVENVNDNTLPQGYSTVETPGKVGTKTITTTFNTLDGVKVAGSEKVDEKVTTEPVKQVVKIGTNTDGIESDKLAPNWGDPKLVDVPDLPQEVDEKTVRVKGETLDGGTVEGSVIDGGVSDKDSVAHKVDNQKQQALAEKPKDQKQQALAEKPKKQALPQTGVSAGMSGFLGVISLLFRRFRK